jgi:hypothetical protein
MENRRISFDPLHQSVMLVSRFHADPAAAGCSSLRAHGRAGFVSLLIEIGFCRVPKRG